MKIEILEEIRKDYKRKKQNLADEITKAIEYNRKLDEQKINMVELNNKMYEQNKKIKQLNEIIKAEEKLKKRKIKVYLSGAIANDKDYISKFMTAKSELSDRGYSVLNPIETEESMHEKGSKECMFASIELLRQADVMLLLDNPETIESKGMQIEKAMARYCDIPVVSDYIELDRFYNCKFRKKEK